MDAYIDFDIRSRAADPRSSWATTRTAHGTRVAQWMSMPHKVKGQTLVPSAHRHRRRVRATGKAWAPAPIGATTTRAQRQDLRHRDFRSSAESASPDWWHVRDYGSSVRTVRHDDFEGQGQDMPAKAGEYTIPPAAADAPLPSLLPTADGKSRQVDERYAETPPGNKFLSFFATLRMTSQADYNPQPAPP